MKFKEILSRVTGLSVPIFGISWNPPEPEIAVARRVIAFLEDRRVLFSPSELESVSHCIESVLRIREFLTEEIGKLASAGELPASLRAMRASCRKFLDLLGDEDGRVRTYGHMMGHIDNWTFNSAVGELRGVFGVHVARLAALHGLDVEAGLASIIPAADDEVEANTRSQAGRRPLRRFR